jgi:hypothetical protein
MVEISVNLLNRPIQSMCAEIDEKEKIFYKNRK